MLLSKKTLDDLPRLALQTCLNYSQLFLGATQLQKASSVITNRTVGNARTPVNITSKRFLRVSSNVLKENFDDFRAREEQKEAEFNSQPIGNKQEKKDETSEDTTVTEIRNKILEASLAFVETSGWTRQSIVKGAEQAGYPGTIHGMFPNGGIELVNYFYLKGNEELIREIHERTGENKGTVENPKDFVAWALRTRLEKIRPHIKSWPQALAMMSLPQNVPKSLAHLLTLVDDICYFTGDRSVDVGFLLSYKPEV